MNLFESIFMGILQGLTEFLPVSSSGHLAILKNLIGLKDVGLAFDILLHLGTLIAVFVAFWKDIVELVVNGFGIIGDSVVNVARFFTNIFRGKEDKKEYADILATPYRRFVMLVIVSTIPTAIMGLLMNDAVEAMGRTLLIPGICLLVTGTLLLIADNMKSGDKDETTVSYPRALFVGICQGIATLPGISRSGTTITACMGCGFNREFAVKYSFIMSIPVILGAAVLEVPDLVGESLGAAEISSYITGMAFSAVVGYICIKTMLKVVRNKKFMGFSNYCYAMGILAIVLHFVR